MLDRASIKRLLPHRSPFLLVESVQAIGHDPDPYLIAELTFSTFEYEFKSWPAVYLIEGLAQSCILLSILHFMAKENMDVLSNKNIDVLADEERWKYHTPGLMASVDISFLESNVIGESATYRVSETRVFGDKRQYSVSAWVDEREVASGTLIGSVPPNLSGR